MKTVRTRAIVLSMILGALLSIVPLFPATARADAHAVTDEAAAAQAPAKGGCTYALRLQKSVAAQRQYLVKVEKARAGTLTAGWNPAPAATPVESAAGEAPTQPAWVSVSWNAAGR